MKKKLIYIATLVCGMFGTTSCEDMLDTESLSTDNLEYLCSNPTDARKMVAHVYSYFCEDPYTSRMSTNWNQNTDVEVGFVSATQAHNADRRGIWALNPSYFGDILKAWDNSLKAIDFANQCIEGIAGSELYQKGDKDMKQLYGEAHCLRAYWYWMMCNFWADVPYASTPTSNMDMHNDPRTDKNIIYSKCIQDLINVEEDMQWSDQITVEYMNREFALGFIVKLAMFRAGYSMQADGTMARSTGTDENYTVNYIDENGNEATATSADDYYKVAKAYALKLMKLKDRALNPNFKQIFDNQINGCNPGNSDVLYEVAFVPNSGGDIGWCHGLTVAESSKGAGSTYCNLTPYYVSQFDKQDQRLAATCANYKWLNDNKQAVTDGSGVQPAKWCRMDLNTTSVASKGTGINWPVLRYSDVLLLLAEAENEMNGPTDVAKQMLTRVRQRAFLNADNATEMVTNYVNALTTKEAFKEAIIKERALEFGGENIRKFDLIRWNYFSTAVANTIKWVMDVTANYQRLEETSEGFVYKKDKEVVDMGIAPRLYYYYKNGKVEFENDYFTYRDPSDALYKSATKLADGDIKAAGATFDGLKYIDFIQGFVSVTAKDPSTNAAYGTDENGDEIKKGIFQEKLFSSWHGLTEGIYEDGMVTSAEIESLKGMVVPYVFPIPTDRILSSNGQLSNEGYAIRNK